MVIAFILELFIHRSRAVYSDGSYIIYIFLLQYHYTEPPYNVNNYKMNPDVIWSGSWTPDFIHFKPDFIMKQCIRHINTVLKNELPAYSRLILIFCIFLLFESIT